MSLAIKGMFVITDNDDNIEGEEKEVILTYRSLPLTPSLMNRKYEEEQIKKYGLTKKKKYSFA